MNISSDISYYFLFKNYWYFDIPEKVKVRQFYNLEIKGWTWGARHEISVITNKWVEGKNLNVTARAAGIINVSMRLY